MARIKNQKSISKSDIQTYYFDQKLSAKEVGHKLGFSVWQIYKFMKKHNLPRRESSVTTKFNFLKSPQSFSKKTKLNSLENKIHIAGLMLYLAEGYKAGKHTVDLANSDPKILKIFLSLLRQVYQVSPQKIKAYIYRFPNQTDSELINFWSNELKIPQNQFTKPYIKLRSNPNPTHKMPYGLVHIRYSDTRLLTQIKSDIDIITNSL